MRPDTLPDRASNLGRLLQIMETLRTPVTGCAWDLAQTFASIAPYTIEEAYEVAEAAARGDILDLRDELGDLLLQVVFYAQIARERGAFDFEDVAASICAKLVRRHPHIFGDTRDLSPEEVKALWDDIKAQEKRARAAERGVSPGDAVAGGPSVLAKVSEGLPPLLRAVRLQERAAAVGFDWPDVSPVLAKVHEEADEVAGVLGDRPDATHARRQEEVGDLLFAAVNLARHAGVDPHAALAGANAKFARRFGAIEQALAVQGKTPAQSDLVEMDALWEAAKANES